MRARRGVRLLAAASALVAVLTGCGLTDLKNLDFTVDNRLHFTSPAARSLVHQPVTLHWTMSDFRVEAANSAPPSRTAGYFAIFVDQSPIRPGQTMKAVASGDTSCEETPGCPNRTYLAEHQVYTTTNTTFRLPRMQNLPGNTQQIQLHTITVVLMDTTGHRIGESAWELDVRARAPNA